ncbi:MAG: hypothetical protein JWO92_1303 [Chitinophagaceae bacterium]|nr:hypothetical protein [Chitinophagaceae bacterium]MDB5221387.1 hypothetical protein [Chitinophagaceae bacterium]
MKNIFKYIAVIIPFITMSSCDKNFEKVNTDPVSLSSIDPAYLFSNAQRLCVNTTVHYEAAIVQQIITPQPGSLAGGNYNIKSDIQTRLTFDSLYKGPVKNLIDVINQTKDVPAKSNLYNMARIVKAYVFQILVDTYGDVPYSEAGLAYLDATYLPKYDAAEDIYNDLLKEYMEATKELDAAKPLSTQELFYNGNIAQWKKLGNSLLLRTAMRLTKVNPAKAQQYVVIATNPANGGLIESVTDNAKIVFSTTFNNVFVERFHAAERGNYYMAAPFVDYLKSTNDPRLKEISVKYQFPANALGSTGTEDTNPANQIGMPLGYNAGTISTAPGFPGAIGGGYAYSQPNRRTVTAITAPAFLVTASQTLLLEAEAAQRGWTSGNVATLYNAGVRAHMNQFKQYLSSSEILPASQDAYLATNPFNPAKALEQINTQYWISSYINWSEAWANFRRSGFPALTPNPYPQADPDVKGGFIRRLTYPDREYSVNEINVKAAVAHQGPDVLSTRIFWDK